MNHVYWVPLLHLVAFTVNILLGRHVKKNAAWISILMSILSCVIALPLAWKVTQGEVLRGAFSWLALGGLDVSFGCLIDPLAATLLFVVTIIGTLIQIYSAGYMSHEPRFSRFFAYLSLFMAAMLTLVIADNYLLFFMAWEVMGLCSYLLIGFYFEKDSAAEASRKAFLTTRVGDIGFFLGIMTLFSITGTLQFEKLAHASMQGPLVAVAAFFLFCGTVGKSAQIPLHVWLPDAMEGPTPVSALIHAATMVAAGVYLLARSVPIFSQAVELFPVITATGTLTAMVAAIIALSATDIKKVLAYSTISQLGFMVAAFGLQGFQASTFHLMTHAFFKALLFLGAGSVIHGSGTQDLRQMGGLFGKMRHTGATFLIGTLAIAGIPPLSGFWSKDEILVAAYHSPYPFVFWLLLCTALLTSFYMFRLLFLAFFGESRNPHSHAHESPAAMTLPLWILAVGAIAVGLPGSPWAHHWFQNFLSAADAHGASAHSLDLFVMGSSILVGLLGMIAAAFFYLIRRDLPAKAAKGFGSLYQLSLNRFYFDEIYHAAVIRPFQSIAGKLFQFDHNIIDAAVNQTGASTLTLSRIKNAFDRYVIDQLVNFVGWFTHMLSALTRLIQTGFIQHYLLIVFLSVILLAASNLR